MRFERIILSNHFQSVWSKHKRCIHEKEGFYAAYHTITCQNDVRHFSKISLLSDFVAVLWLLLRKKILFTELQSFRCCGAMYYLLTPNFIEGPFETEGCCLVALLPCCLAAIIDRCLIRHDFQVKASYKNVGCCNKRNIRPPKVGVAHSNQRNILQHSIMNNNETPSCSTIIWHFIYALKSR